MNTFIKFSFVALAISTGIGCAKTESQKVQEQQAKTQDTKAEADRALADLTASLPQLRQKPEPTENWNDQDFKTYQDLLDTNERNLNKLESFNGKDGVKIQGEQSLTETRKMINQKRVVLQTARTKRAEATVAQSKEARVAELNKQLETDSNYLETEGAPTNSWPEDKIAKYEAALTRIDATLHELETTAGESAGNQEKKKKNEDRRALIASARKK
jgi:hypothetical protein